MSFERHLQSGPLEKKVRELWQSYEQKPIRSVRHLWRLWRLHREFSLDTPDFSQWTWQFPKGQIPQCSLCQDNCCRGPHSTVLLRLVDVALFVDRGWTDKITLEKPVFSPEVLAARPMLKAMVDSFHWRIFPVLRQKRDATCTFLSEEGRCTIHPQRPWICRVFPYVLDIDSRSIGWSERCQWPVVQEEGNPVARELEHAVGHNFYTEKIRDLVLVSVYREELEAMGLGAWLNLHEVGKW